MMPKDPIKAEATREKMRKSALNRTRESIDRMAETQRKRLASPEVRAQMSIASKTALADPIVKEKMRKNTEEQWKNPVMRNQIIVGMNSTRSTPEYRTKCKSSAIKRKDNPEYIKNTSISAKKRFESPLERMRIAEARLGGFWYGNLRYYDDRPQYCEKFNAEFKERVRTYWNFICFECGEPQNGEKLHVHHIHYDKKMCCNGSPQDVVPLCRVCHSKTNYNRDYWEDHFTDLLYAYDPEGKCFFTKEEMKKFTSSTF